LKKLQGFHEPLGGAELNAAVTFVNNGDIDAMRSADEAWRSLDALLV
jgi:hypothetical protein